MTEVVTKEEFAVKLECFLQAFANEISKIRDNIGCGFRMVIRERNEIRCIFTIESMQFHGESFCIWLTSEGKVKGAPIIL